MSSRTRLGWDPFFENQIHDRSAGSTFARVVEVQRGAWRLDGDHEGWADISGRLRHDAAESAALPAVGDWVEVARGVIVGCLERRSVISRAAAGRASAEQVIAANVDTIFVVTSANEDLNARRLERYLAIAWDGGAVPVVVINKIDLAADPDSIVASIAARLPFVDVVTSCAIGGDGGADAVSVAALQPYLVPGRTVALVGSSGVGKSTLLNRLAGRDLQPVGAIRESDGRGRHTTTARQLIELAGGALLIDTPGMRELQAIGGESAVDAAFEDVLALAARCRFGDCAHETEPGCAVRAAVEAGTLAADRLENYRRLLREAAFEAAKHDKAAAANSKKRWKQIANAQKALYRDRDRH